MNWEFFSLWAAVVAYAIGGAAAIFGVVLRRNLERVIAIAMTIGFSLHVFAIAFRWVRLGHGPYVTMFEILSSNLWSLMAVFLWSYWRIPSIRNAAAFVMPVLFTMMGWLVLADRHEGALPATYHTVWLFIHIGFSKLFAGSVLVALGLAVVILLRRFGVWTDRLATLPETARLDELAYRLMIIGFVFETLMLITGAIWAQDAWGRYWAWDPLETWAFITWLSLGVYVHARASLSLRVEWGAAMIVAVFVLAFLTFFGVPLVSQVPHQGAV